MASGSNDFGQPHEQIATEIDPTKTLCLGASRRGAISVEDSLSAPPQTSTSQSELARPPRMGAQGIEEEL